MNPKLVQILTFVVILTKVFAVDLNDALSQDKTLKKEPADRTIMTCVYPQYLLKCSKCFGHGTTPKPGEPTLDPRCASGCNKCVDPTPASHVMLKDTSVIETMKKMKQNDTPEHKQNLFNYKTFAVVLGVACFCVFAVGVAVRYLRQRRIQPRVDANGQVVAIPVV